MISFIIQAVFNYNSAQGNKQQRIYDLLHAETKPNESCVYKVKKTILRKKEDFKDKGEWRNEQKKKDVLTALATSIKKGPTMSIRKYPKELKVHEKTVWTAIKQDVSQDINPLITFYGVFKKTE